MTRRAGPTSATAIAEIEGNGDMMIERQLIELLVSRIAVPTDSAAGRRKQAVLTVAQRFARPQHQAAASLTA